MLNIFRTTTIPALEQTIVFAQRRHELLAGNLANVDTPNYRTRDLDVTDFQNALAESIHQTEQPSARLQQPWTRDEVFASPRTAMEQVVLHDGSDVSVEHQVSELAKNQHLHSLAVSTMRSQFALLRAAITERA